MTVDLSGLRKFVAPEFVFGRGARHLVGRYAQNFGAYRVLIVSDPGIVEAGWIDDIRTALAVEELRWDLYTEVTPNPRNEEVMAGADHYRSQACDVIVAVGGGSVIDCAKGIAVVAANGESIDRYEGIDRVAAPGPPLIAVPTTAGTAADLSQFAIIANLVTRRKFAIISKAVVPDVALVDSETTATLSPFLTACTGIDALVHAIEAYVSLGHSPIVDVHALSAIRLVRDNLEAAVRDPADVVARENMMQASLQAGLAFSNASLGAVHAMAHSLGGLFDLPHGECNAMLLPHVIAYNFPAAEDRYGAIGDALGLDLRGLSRRRACTEMLETIDRLRRSVGIEQTLGGHGVRRSDVDTLAEAALMDPCLVTNPRRPDRRDLAVVYEEAL